MKNLRFWFVALIAWLFLLYNVERLSGPINIASFVYLMTIVLAVGIILFPWVQKIALTWLLILPLPVFFALKVWLGYQIEGANLPITVTEVCALALTVILSRRVGACVEEFRQAVTNVMIGHLEHMSQSFEVGQGAMYGEMRRARASEQPLALLAISASPESLNLAIDRFIEEIQRQTVHKYIAARLASFLSEQLRDFDIITQRNDHFVTLLPGIDHDDVAGVAEQLVVEAKKDLGLELKIGAATFPAEEVTFEKLVEHAEQEMVQAAEKASSQTALAAPEPLTGREAPSQQAGSSNNGTVRPLNNPVERGQTPLNHKTGG